jgi:hypothetical protein
MENILVVSQPYFPTCEFGKGIPYSSQNRFFLSPPTTFVIMREHVLPIVGTFHPVANSCKACMPRMFCECAVKDEAVNYLHFKYARGAPRWTLGSTFL